MDIKGSNQVHLNKYMMLIFQPNSQSITQIMSITTTTHQVDCPRVTQLCMRAKYTFMICKQLIIKRETTRRKWLCFSYSHGDDTYHTAPHSKKFQLKRITYTDFIVSCQSKHYTNWEDGTYKIFIGSTSWGECGIVDMVNGKIVKITPYQ